MSNQIRQTLKECRDLDNSLGLELEHCRERGREINAISTRNNLHKTGRLGPKPINWEDEEKALAIIKTMRFPKDGSKPMTRKVIANYLNGIGLSTVSGYDFTDQNIARLEEKLFSVN